jgi:hypothetical protein
MKASNFLFLPTIVGSGLVLAEAPPAPVILNNVPGACALARIIPDDATGATLDVAVAVATALNGKGVNVTINMNGGPGQNSGPYSMFPNLFLSVLSHQQCTTSTKSRSRRMETALLPEVIWILPRVASLRRATSETPPSARSAICPASSALARHSPAATRR